MAGTITHAYFVLDLYDRLSIRSKELLIDYKDLLKLFAQSNNVLYFYDAFNLKKDKSMRNFGYYFHRNKTYEFFSTLINYIKYNNHQYNPQVMAYLYGMLSHYVLDSTINPFTIYKTGKFNKNDKLTYKYNNKHVEMESYFDNYLLRLRTGINPYKFKCHKYLFNINNIDKDLIEVIDFTYREVFEINDFHKYYFKSCDKMKKFYKVFRYDRFGLKKMIYSFIDFILPDNHLRKVPLSYHISKKGKKDFLNLEHKRWYNPTDKRTKSDQSILELYTSSLWKCENMIKDINQYLYYDKKINLKKVIGNLSYENGKDCSKKRELKYFEF